MNKFVVVALLLTSLLACSGEAESLDGGGTDASGKTELSVPTPLAFGAYVNRVTTRAGYVGELTTSTGTRNLQTEGFGVFAYYTDDKLYSPAYQPNFMYNTKVHTANWSYEPVRYWPNETGSNAESQSVDRLSFFAYAPWVEVTPATGIVTATGDDAEYGIVSLTRNGATGDPFVRYNVSLDPAKQVDFCWGVAGEDFTSSADASLPNNIQSGKPFVDVMKPASGSAGKIKFNFKHALTALNVKIDAAVDGTTASTAVPTATKVYVRQVSFEGFALKGSFNLNTDKATWYDPSGSAFLSGGPVTVYDGRTDGREGQAKNENETPTGLNENIVQSVAYGVSGVKSGVMATAANLFKSSTPGASLYVIPTTRPLRITIVYSVETIADNLPGYLGDGQTHGSSVQSSITRKVTLAGSSADILLETGKKYTVNLHLGVGSVQASAMVGEWDGTTTGETEIKMEEVTLESSITPWILENE